MNKLLVIPFAVFVAVFWLEEIFPHVLQKVSRSLHGLNNIAISFLGGIINVVFLVFFIPVVQRWNPAGQAGLLGGLTLAPVVSIALLFLVFDLWMYLWHMANHRIGLLWLFHRAHHSDTDMDSTTALRTHPFELVAASFFNVWLVSFFGVNMSHLLFYNLAYQSLVFFHHSNIALPARFDRFLRVFLVTPAMHRLHHCPDKGERNTNYGIVFSCWDRILRTFLIKEGKAGPYGLFSFREKKWQDIGGFLRIPFVDEKDAA